ncbi:hypothetical protein BDD12DRAFT_274047 [Trichophaea hybrida]|nr:hypothetical protein BDD12DRAFT_274047 [Trichophaea hybrida]
MGDIGWMDGGYGLPELLGEVEMGIGRDTGNDGSGEERRRRVLGGLRRCQLLLWLVAPVKYCEELLAQCAEFGLVRDHIRLDMCPTRLNAELNVFSCEEGQSIHRSIDSWHSSTRNLRESVASLTEPDASLHRTPSHSPSLSIAPSPTPSPLPYSVSLVKILYRASFCVTVSPLMVASSVGVINLAC